MLKHSNSKTLFEIILDHFSCLDISWTKMLKIRVIKNKHPSITEFFVDNAQKDHNEKYFRKWNHGKNIPCIGQEGCYITIHINSYKTHSFCQTNQNSYFFCTFVAFLTLFHGTYSISIKSMKAATKKLFENKDGFQKFPLCNRTYFLNGEVPFRSHVLVCLETYNLR